MSVVKLRGIERGFTCDVCGLRMRGSVLAAPHGWAEVMMTPDGLEEQAVRAQVCSSRCGGLILRSGARRLDEICADQWAEEDRQGVERTPRPVVAIRIDDRFGVLPWPSVREQWAAEGELEVTHV